LLGNSLSKMFYFQENFITDFECEKIIELYENNSNLIKKYRNTFILNLSCISDNVIQNIHKQVIDLCEKLSDEKIKLDNYEIVKWPEESFQDPHYDGDDVFAVVIYLNDNFIGGRTCFDFDTNIIIKPKRGKCLIFSNSKYLHWVEKIQKGNRYTLAYWFVK
jgi:hypothetical protein